MGVFYLYQGCDHIYTVHDVGGDDQMSIEQEGCQRLTTQKQLTR